MDNWLTSKEVSEKSGLSKGTLKTYLSSKLMPTPDKFFSRTPVWKEETIDNWIHTRRRIKPIPSKEDSRVVRYDSKGEAFLGDPD